MRTLIISDHEDELRLLSLLATAVGFDVLTVWTVDELTTGQILHHGADVIVLATLDADALLEVQTVRNLTAAPLMVIVSSLEDELHAALLETGADVGIRRPYAPRLLTSQLRALTRRGAARDASSFSVPYELVLGPRMRTVRIGNGPMHQLSQLEFRLLETLLAQRGLPVPSAELLEKVWDFGPQEETDLVRNLVKRLRNKIEPDPSKPEYVITVPGSGYALRERGVEWNLEGEGSPVPNDW